MVRDKQLSHLRLEDVVEKRRLDQALNAKEFAILVGISYSAARGWFRMPGFPVIRGVVFWQDFVQWRNAQSQLGLPAEEQARPAAISCPQGAPTHRLGLSPRALELLARAG
jgi:hypothetical protein